jgi:predicted DNA-binding protein (MmcQ/YjbR family)
MENKITEQRVLDQLKYEEYKKIGKKTTICLLTTKSGFEIVGSSACVDLESYNKILGESIAYENAIKKLCEMEGYSLQKELFAIKKPCEKIKVSKKMFCRCETQLIDDNIQPMHDLEDNPLYRHTCKSCKHEYWLNKRYPVKEYKREDV